MKHTTKKSKAHPIPSVGDRIISGLTEFETALRNKERITERFTVRTVELHLEPHDYDGRAVKALRQTIRVSQSVFAALLGVSVHAVQSWEQDKREIPKIARRLLDEIHENPEKWVTMLRNGSKRREVAV